MRQRRLVQGGLALLLAAACSSEPALVGGSPSLGRQILDAAACNGHPATCPGAAKSTVKLVNMQDDAPGLKKGAQRAVADFTGKPVFVALLQGW